MSVTVPTVIIERKKDVTTIKSKSIPNTKDRKMMDYSIGLEKRNKQYFLRRQYNDL